MDISFIIPTYNGAKLLGRVLGSIFVADPQVTEVVIIDDGSSDETPQICKQWKEKYECQIIYKRQENRGAAAARNLGLQVACGEWLWIVDCDDEVPPEAVSAFKQLVECEDPPNAVIGAYKVTNGKVCHLQVPGPLAEDKEQRVIDFLFKKKLRPTHGAVIVNRRCVGQLEYCETMRQSEDLPVFVKLLLNEKVVVTDHCLAITHRSDVSMRHDATFTAENIDRLVDEVFKVSGLSERVLRLRQKYTATRCLSASRIILRSGGRDAARQCFWRGVYAYPVSLFWLKSIRFLLRAYLPFSSSQSF